ncbi:hypothetical protein CRG98_035361 [Punica granatum]|uniref:DUF4283 domain-containing protein n=1 Tax=Punica granatum TaxID=22663 RepID=A0A2I0IJU9_PUNGR|nr:hypothetical protein CRG98_035361 [Punica granatum]
MSNPAPQLSAIAVNSHLNSNSGEKSTPKGPLNWKKVFPKVNQNLEFFEGVEHSNVKPPSEFLQFGVDQWCFTLVRRFLGKAPDFGKVASYFHPKGISYLVSAIGKPLFMDRATALRSRLDYAKVCIEVDVEKEILEFLNVDLGNNYSVEVLVDIPWLPDKCDHCKVFGHRCNSPAEVSLVAGMTPNVQHAEKNCPMVEATLPANPTTLEEPRAAKATSRTTSKARLRCVAVEKASPAAVTIPTDKEMFMEDLISEKEKTLLSFEPDEEEEGSCWGHQLRR